MNSNECKIQHRLFNWLCYQRKHRWIVPNARDIFSTGECDVFSMNRTGAGYEWEIKISRSDFKADAKKGKYEHFELRRSGSRSYIEVHRNVLGEPMQRRGPMSEFYARKITTPNYFSYVVPTDLITADEVPDYAGLFYIDSDIWIKEIKKPARIHGDAMPDHLRLTLGDKLMYRFWNERERVIAFEQQKILAANGHE